MSDILDTPQLPTVRTLMSEASAREKEAKGMQSRADAGMDRIDQERRGEFERRKGEREGDTQEYQRRIGDIQQATTQRPHTEMPNPDLGPMLDPKQTQDFAWAIFAMSVAGAAAGRKHWGEATAALDGMLQGMKAGSEDIIKEKKAKFDREFRVAKEKQLEATKVYDDILRSKELSLNAVAELIRVHAHANQDWDMEQAARERNYDRMYARVGQMRTAADRLQTQATTLSDRIAAREEKRADRKAMLASQGVLDENTLKFMAGQYLDGGDRTVFQNLGRGAQGAQNVIALRKMIQQEAEARHMSPKEVSTKIAEFSGLMAAERTAGTRSANVEMAVNEARNMKEVVLDASRAFPRTEFMPINKALKAWEDNTGSVASRNLGAAINSYINIYARAISPTGVPTVSDKDHAREILSAADSEAQLESRLELLDKEMAAAQKSPGQVREHLREGFAGGGGAGGAGKTINWNDLPP